MQCRNLGVGVPHRRAVSGAHGAHGAATGDTDPDISTVWHLRTNCSDTALLGLTTVRQTDDTGDIILPTRFCCRNSEFIASKFSPIFLILITGDI